MQNHHKVGGRECDGSGIIGGRECDGSGTRESDGSHGDISQRL